MHVCPECRSRRSGFERGRLEVVTITQSDAIKGPCQSGAFPDGQNIGKRVRIRACLGGDATSRSPNLQFAAAY